MRGPTEPRGLSVCSQKAFFIAATLAARKAHAFKTYERRSGRRGADSLAHRVLTLFDNLLWWSLVPIKSLLDS